MTHILTYKVPAPFCKNITKAYFVNFFLKLLSTAEAKKVNKHWQRTHTYKTYTYKTQNRCSISVTKIVFSIDIYTQLQKSCRNTFVLIVRFCVFVDLRLCVWVNVSITMSIFNKCIKFKYNFLFLCFWVLFCASMPFTDHLLLCYTHLMTHTYTYKHKHNDTHTDTHNETHIRSHTMTNIMTQPMVNSRAGINYTLWYP